MTKTPKLSQKRLADIKKDLYQGLQGFHKGTRKAHFEWAKALHSAIGLAGWERVRTILVTSVGGKSATVSFFKKMADAYAVVSDEAIWIALELDDVFGLCTTVPDEFREDVIKKILTYAKLKSPTDYATVKGCIYREFCREAEQFKAAEEGRCANKAAKPASPQTSRAESPSRRPSIQDQEDHDLRYGIGLVLRALVTLLDHPGLGDINRKLVSQEVIGFVDRRKRAADRIPGMEHVT
jgi:hypothetical protein